MPLTPDIATARVLAGRKREPMERQSTYRSARGGELRRPSQQRTRPDYGCVEWFFYDERSERHEGV
jgi:hypothetical protein